MSSSNLCLFLATSFEWIQYNRVIQPCDTIVDMGPLNTHKKYLKFQVDNLSSFWCWISPLFKLFKLRHQFISVMLQFFHVDRRNLSFCIIFSVTLSSQVHRPKQTALLQKFKLSYSIQIQLKICRLEIFPRFY